MIVKHVRIKVIGKVQGVFFRQSTKEKADELGVNGLVRNEPDGSVYIEAEGDQDVLDRFITWCSQGPRSARVDTIETREGNVKWFDRFKIER